MSKTFLFALLIVMVPYGRCMSLTDIHQERLPHDSSVTSALHTAQELEPYVQGFVPEWTAPIPRAKAASELQAAQNTMEKARQKYPDNAEVALLSGHIASYGFNLDVANSWDVAPAAFAAATRLAPQDPRGEWSAAAHNCQTIKSLMDGMQAMLRLGSQNPELLPSSFWLDYAVCAMETQMPAHTQYALRKLDAAERSTALADALNAHNAGAADEKKSYNPDELWEQVPQGSDVEYRSYACGIAFTAPKEWQPQFYPVSKGRCAVMLGMPPIPGKKGSWTPNIVVITNHSAPDTTFADFAKGMEGSAGDTVENTHLNELCPVRPCRASDHFSEATYPSEGGGHGMMILFSRSQPADPGLALEANPIPLPGKDGETIVRPATFHSRFAGEMYYSILLDSAVSILPQALPQYEAFLKSVRVD